MNVISEFIIRYRENFNNGLPEHIARIIKYSKLDTNQRMAVWALYCYKKQIAVTFRTFGSDQFLVYTRDTSYVAAPSGDDVTNILIAPRAFKSTSGLMNWIQKCLTDNKITIKNIKNLNILIQELER